MLYAKTTPVNHFILPNQEISDCLQMTVNK